MADDDANETRLHRNGSTSPLGKLDDKFESFRVEGIVKAKFAEKAALCGKGATEFLRDVMRVVALGPDDVKRMHCDQVDQVVRMLAGKSE